MQRCGCGYDRGSTRLRISEFFYFFGTEEVMFWIYPHKITSTVPKIKNQSSGASVLGYDPTAVELSFFLSYLIHLKTDNGIY